MIELALDEVSPYRGAPGITLTELPSAQVNCVFGNSGKKVGSIKYSTMGENYPWYDDNLNCRKTE